MRCSILRRYFLFCGIIAHVVAGLALAVLLVVKLEDHWRVEALSRWLNGLTDSTELFSLEEVAPGTYGYAGIPQGKWIKIHQQRETDALHFTRQVHSGSAWDSKRGRLVIVGSDTHGDNWDNSLYFFDIHTLKWQRAYDPDPLESYRVDSAGVAVAGLRETHPWAMHVFDAVDYDAANDALVLASHPGHLNSARMGEAKAGLLERVSKHPTWVYSFSTRSWNPWPGQPQSFFPYASAYDTNRGVVVGFRPDGVFEFDGAGNGWTKVAKRSVNGWHTQAVYDGKHDAFVVFGTNNHDNFVHVYRAGDVESREMPTPGRRPPGASSPPLAFNSKLGKVVALVDTDIDGDAKAQTWLYDAGSDRWQLLEGADFPFRLGMNYHLQYSKRDDLLVLLASTPLTLPGVWVLRL